MVISGVRFCYGNSIRVEYDYNLTLIVASVYCDNSHHGYAGSGPSVGAGDKMNGPLGVFAVHLHATFAIIQLKWPFASLRNCVLILKRPVQLESLARQRLERPVPVAKRLYEVTCKKRRRTYMGVSQN